MFIYLINYVQLIFNKIHLIFNLTIFNYFKFKIKLML